MRQSVSGTVSTDCLSVLSGVSTIHCDVYLTSRGFMSVSGRLFLTLDTGFVCDPHPHGYIGNIPCYWYFLGHLWTSYIQWYSDFSNCKCCAQAAQYAEPETPKRGYGQCL